MGKKKLDSEQLSQSLGLLSDDMIAEAITHTGNRQKQTYLKCFTKVAAIVLVATLPFVFRFILSSTGYSGDNFDGSTYKICDMPVFSEPCSDHLYIMTTDINIDYSSFILKYFPTVTIGKPIYIFKTINSKEQEIKYFIPMYEDGKLTYLAVSTGKENEKLSFLGGFYIEGFNSIASKTSPDTPMRLVLTGGRYFALIGEEAYAFSPALQGYEGYIDEINTNGIEQYLIIMDINK